MRPLKNRSGSNREVLLALIAAIETALMDRDTISKPTNGASRTILPKASFKIDPRRLLVREHLEKLECGNSKRFHGGLKHPPPVYQLVQIGRHPAPTLPTELKTDRLKNEALSCLHARPPLSESYQLFLLFTRWVQHATHICGPSCA
jgi:hypothetical protein